MEVGPLDERIDRPGCLAALGVLIRAELPEKTDDRRTSPWAESALGENRMLGSGGKRAPDIHELTAVAEEGAAATRLRLEKVLSIFARRLRVASRVRFVAATVAALSTSISLVSKEPAAIQIGAVVSFVSSLLITFQDHLEKPILGAQKPLADLFADTLALERRIGRLQSDMRIKKPTREDAVQRALEMNDVSSQILALELIGGVKLKG